MIYLILLGADMLNSALALTGMTNQITSWIVANEFPPLMILGIILLLYILLGCVMESMSMIMLTIPIFYPMIMALDFWGLAPQEKSIWFGVLALMVVEIGLITPPVGIVLYVVNRLLPDVPMIDTFRGVVPFLISDILRILIVVLVPSVALILL
jgi:C4-dicarboxylate transporter DctM subunit